MLTVVTDDNAHADMAAGLDEIVREGARRMLAAALETEVAGYIEGLAGELDDEGHRLVVRNGHAPSPLRRAGSRSRRRGSMIVGSIPRPASGAGSARPSSRRGVARAPRWPKSCR